MKPSTSCLQGQRTLETDVSELKHGQRDMNNMMLKLLEEMTSLKKIVINIENDLRPKVMRQNQLPESSSFEYPS